MLNVTKVKKMPSSKKKSNKVGPLKRKYSFSLLQIVAFCVVFGGIGVYVVASSSASRVSSMPGCSISPSTPSQGDSLTVTAKLPPVPSDSRDGEYQVKNDTPYNTAYGDRVIYDAATGTATYQWNAGVVKGKYGFYFVYMKKGADPEVVAKRDIVRVSQSCSVNVL